jgi:hypothetical protein
MELDLAPLSDGGSRAIEKRADVVGGDDVAPVSGCRE